MGTVTKRKRKSGVRFRAEVHVDGIRESKTFNTLSLAHAWIEEKENSIRTGTPMDGEMASNDMLLYEAMERCIVESRAVMSVAQIKSYEYSERILRRTFPPEKKMSEVTKQEMAAHMLKRMTEDGVGPTSIKNEFSFIRRVYQQATSWGIDIPSPELSIKRPKAKMKSREDRLDNIIKPDELVCIFTEAKKSRNNLYNYLKFLLYTGMRPSEAACLYWERLPVKLEKEMEKKKLPIGFVDLERGGFSKIGTKTEKRFVPAHETVLNLIAKMQETRLDEKKLVFLDDKYIGRYVAYKYYRRSFQTVTKNAVVSGTQLRGGINFYSFRHTFRSALEECGVSTAFAETIIGHRDTSFKFTYIHLSDEALVNAINLLKYEIDL